MGRSKEEEFSLSGCLTMVLLALVAGTCVVGTCADDEPLKPIRNTTAEELLSAAERDADAFNQDWEHYRPRITGHVVRNINETLYLGTPETERLSFDVVELHGLRTTSDERLDQPWELVGEEVTALCEGVGAYISHSKWGDMMSVQTSYCELEAR